MTRDEMEDVALEHLGMLPDPPTFVVQFDWTTLEQAKADQQKQAEKCDAPTVWKDAVPSGDGRLWLEGVVSHRGQAGGSIRDVLGCHYTFDNEHCARNRTGWDNTQVGQTVYFVPAPRNEVEIVSAFRPSPFTFEEKHKAWIDEKVKQLAEQVDKEAADIYREHWLNIGAGRKEIK